ncbi:MAG: hypothetical protein NTW96_16235 [Planctomycetia bacterium]|nr:hypothetical protein [Planctomycetia bacterium]
MRPRDNRLATNLGVVVFSSPLEEGAGRADQASLDVVRRLEAAGHKTLHAGAVDTPDKAVSAGRRLAEAHVHAVVMVAACWFEDYLAFDLIEECRVPLLLWSLPGIETGALCGIQQLTYALGELGIAFETVHGDANDERLARPIERFAQAASLHYRLRRSRIGLAGHPVAGMSDATANELALKRHLGPRVVPLDVRDLVRRAEQMPAETARQAWAALVGRVGKCSVSEDDGLDSMCMLAAIEEQIEKHGLDAVAIGCYPHLMGRPCVAASILADRGVPLACEGDVNGAVGQLILTLLTGQPTHNTDWLEPLDDGSVVLTHCGSGSLSLAEKPDSIELANVRLMNQGVCVLFTAKPGPVTLVNLVPHGDGYQLALLEGTAISTEMVFPGNPLRVRFDTPTETILAWIHAQGIGHHWMAGSGHVGQTIRLWAERFAGPGLRVCPGP